MNGGMTAAYVAGLIDGEGCLYIVRRKKWFYPRLDLAMADKALPLLQKLHHQFGGSLNLHRKATERWDGAHRWALMGQPLRELLTNCLPFFQVKKRQAELCLNLNPRDAETIRALLTELNRKGPPVTQEAGWFARRVGDQWLTPQQNFIDPTGFTVFSETWPRSGMTQNGTAYRLPPLAPLTDATGSGLWPTPNLPNGGRTLHHVDEWRGNSAYHKGKKVQVDLNQAVKMLPTPRPCSGLRSSGANRTEIMRALEKWPTPRTFAAMGTTFTEESLGRLAARAPEKKNLEELVAARLLPTPTVQDASNNGGPSQYERNSLPLNAVIGGALNPLWVEWLMGFPLAWTDLAASAMLSSRKSRS